MKLANYYFFGIFWIHDSPNKVQLLIFFNLFLLHLQSWPKVRDIDRLSNTRDAKQLRDLFLWHIVRSPHRQTTTFLGHTLNPWFPEQGAAPFFSNLFSPYFCCTSMPYIVKSIISIDWAIKKMPSDSGTCLYGIKPEPPFCEGGIFGSCIIFLGVL